MNGERTPLPAHIPFHLTDDYKTVEMHLVRSKPIARAITDGSAPAKLMTPEVMEKMMRQIVSCEFYIEEVQHTWKLNQNKPENAQLSAADQVEKHNIGSDTHLLAGFMREA